MATANNLTGWNIQYSTTSAGLFFGVFFFWLQLSSFSICVKSVESQHGHVAV